jgi:pimeloyl-ACP methyl ester carboxylesterase
MPRKKREEDRYSVSTSSRPKEQRPKAARPFTDPILDGYSEPSLAQRAGSGSIDEREGLRRAYQQGHAYSHGNELFIAGSHTARDWYDDVTKIPPWRYFFGGPHSIERYQAAKKAFDATQPERVVGHSLGGAVALQLQKENPEVKSRTYGAPVVDFTGSSQDRFRHYGDPVSILDRGAQSTVDWAPFSHGLSGPHSYDADASRFTVSGDAKASPAGVDAGTVQITE